jgi:hypothetical protein
MYMNDFAIYFDIGYKHIAKAARDRQGRKVKN